MENFKLSSFFTYDHNPYILQASEEKIIIYSTDLLNEMQVNPFFSSIFSQIFLKKLMIKKGDSKFRKKNFVPCVFI